MAGNFSPIVGALYTQSVDDTAAGILAASIPTSATWAEGYVRTASVVITKDGTTPTATLGLQADPGDVIFLRSRDEIVGYTALRQAATTATVDWEFYSGRLG